MFSFEILNTTINDKPQVNDIRNFVNRMRNGQVIA